MAKFIIELGYESASACKANGEEIRRDSDGFSDWMDCTTSGDCQSACEFMLDQHEIEFRIVAKNTSGEYENRLATPEEKQHVCEAIYFESETDFTDEHWADIYLVWQVADDIRYTDENSEDWEECANCEEDVHTDNARTSDHYEGATCCEDCHNEMIDLHVRCKGDPYHDLRTY